MANYIRLNEALRSIIMKGDVDTAIRYGEELNSASEKRQKAKDDFKENAAKIKELKEQIKEITSKIKTAATKEEKALLGAQIKEINVEIEGLKTSEHNSFYYLSSDVKAYAGALFLAKIMTTPEVLTKHGVPFEYNDGILQVDGDNLTGGELGGKITSLSDYVFGRVREMNDKVTQPADIRNIIKLDAKRLLDKDIDETGITFDLIEEIHIAFEKEKAEIERKNKEIAQRREESRTGIELVKEYPDGYSIYEMLPSPVYDESGNVLHHTSLKYESDEMGHCVGRGGYNQYIGKDGWKFYTLRGPDENGVLVPHCTISIENGQLKQIKGNSNTAVKFKYLPDVRDFVQSLNMPIPQSEKQYIGYIRDINNKEVDLFDLPEGVELDKLQLQYGTSYKGVKLENIESVNELILDGKFDENTIKQLSVIKHIKSFTIKSDDEADGYSKYPINCEKLIIQNAKIPENFGNATIINIVSAKDVDFNRDWRNIKKLEINSSLGVNFADMPILEEGISGGKWGDVSKFTTKELLTKLNGPKWVEEHLREENGKIIIDTDIDLSNRGLTSLPNDFGKIETSGEINLKSNQIWNISSFPKYNKLLLEQGVKFNINNVPFSEGGIEGGHWGNLSEQSTKDVLSKMLGTKWTEAHLSEDDKTINTFVDLSYRNLLSLPRDFGEHKINGALNLTHNRIDDETYEINYPECKELVIGFTYDRRTNPNRLASLPSPKLGIRLDNVADINFKECDIIDVIKKTKMLDETKLSQKDGVWVYDGDIDWSQHCIFNSTDDYGQWNVPQNLSSLHITGEFTPPYWLREFPQCKKINLGNVGDVVVLPDSVEVCKLRQADGLCDISGKNLKEVILGETGSQITVDATKMSPDILYRGNIALRLEKLEKGKVYDFSNINIAGDLTIYGSSNCEAIVKLPNATKVRFFDPITEKEAFMINPKTEVIEANKYFDVDLLPENSSIRHIAFGYNSGITKEQKEDLAPKIAQREIKVSGIDMSDVQYAHEVIQENIDMRWDKDHKDISDLPQMEKLKICSPEWGFDSKFLKDASPHLKVLELGYMQTDNNDLVDYSVIPENVKLEEFYLYDSKAQDTLLEELPKSLKSIKLLRVSHGNLDLEPLNRMPNLEELDISQMKIADNAFDKVDPEVIKRLKITGDNNIVMRVEELKAIYNLPDTPDNRKIRQAHDWLISDDSSIPYDVKRTVFYSLANDVMRGKHPQPITDEEIAARVRGVQNFMLDSCAKIIMAEEKNHEAGDDKAGRAVLEENKGKRPGFYGHVGKYFTRERSMGKLGKMLKTIMTKKIEHHPDFEPAQRIVSDRMKSHIRSLQLGFHEQLAAQNSDVRTYEHVEKYYKPNYSFNKAVAKWHEEKRFH